MEDHQDPIAYDAYDENNRFPGLYVLQTRAFPSEIIGIDSNTGDFESRPVIALKLNAPDRTDVTEFEEQAIIGTIFAGVCQDENCPDDPDPHSHLPGESDEPLHIQMRAYGAVMSLPVAIDLMQELVQAVNMAMTAQYNTNIPHEPSKSEL